jgi:hypothetical protein
MVTLGARMTAGIGGTHKNLRFTCLVRLKSGGIDSTRCHHVQDTHDAVIVHAHILHKFNLWKLTISQN